MGYVYQEHRPRLFTEDGVQFLMKLRDNVQRLCKLAGAVRASEAWNGAGGGDTWMMLAAIDYLVECGEIREVTPPGSVWGQHRVFVRVDGGA